MRREYLLNKAWNAWLFEIVSFDAYLTLLKRLLDRRCGHRTKGTKINEILLVWI